MEAFFQQTRARALLSALLGQGRIGNALLFLGPAGAGQEEGAKALMMAANCPFPGSARDGGGLGDVFGDLSPCGRCPSCRRILGGNHPDYLVVRREGAFVKKGAVKDLLAMLALKPGEGRLRLAVIPEAARMNKEAANALLKSLEEPPAQTAFVLVAEGAADLLPTLVSRCRPVRFAPLAPGVVESFLTREKKAASEAAGICAKLSGGSLPRAAELLESGAWRRSRFFEERLSELLDGRAGDPLLRALLLSELMARSGKESAAESLDMIRGLLRCRLSEAGGKAARSACCAGLSAVESARRDLAGNVSPRLAMDGFFFSLLKN